MPSYTMKNKKTGEVKEMVLSFSERDVILESGEWEQMVSSPRLVGMVGDMKSRVPSGFNDVLSRIKSGSGRGNTIDR